MSLPTNTSNYYNVTAGTDIVISLEFDYMPFDMTQQNFSIDFHLWIAGNPNCSLDTFINCEACSTPSFTAVPVSSTPTAEFAQNIDASVGRNNSVLLRAIGQGCTINVWYPRMIARVPGITSIQH